MNINKLSELQNMIGKELSGELSCDGHLNTSKELRINATTTIKHSNN